MPTWAGVSAWVGVAAEPIAYAYPAYSTTVIYDDPTGADAVAHKAQADEAAELAEAGQNPDAGADWMELGVFALVVDGQTQPGAMVQMSVSKEGIIKGTYYDVLTDTTQPLSGSLDTTTQKVAWSLDSNKSIVYETGLETLTEDQGPMLVYFGGNQTQKWTMVRVEEEAS